MSGCLLPLIMQVLTKGSITTIKLSDAVTNGRQRWLQWHTNFAEQLPALIEVQTPQLPFLGRIYELKGAKPIETQLFMQSE